MVHSHTPTIKKDLVIILIKASTYDKDGYLIRSKWAPLPSNTLATMISLTKEAFSTLLLQNINYQIEIYNEDTFAQKVRVKKIMARHQHKKVIIGLVGIQSCMFPRASDLANEFQAAGATIIMGGFHITGGFNMLYYGTNPDNPCPHIIPPEFEELMNKGIILFHGEAEELWPQVIKDIYDNNYKTLYHGGMPDIFDTPLPIYPPNFFEGFLRKLFTIEAGRGCPYNCSFCTIKNVLGKNSRPHSPEKVVENIKSICLKEKNPHFFITDDNFARNPFCFEILLGLEKLQQQGFRFSLMIQSDVLCYKLTKILDNKTFKFIELFAKAGGSNIFFGIESLDPNTLKEVRKFHNRIDGYTKICALLHKYGITSQASYIIGWPNDTSASIAADIQELKKMGFDQLALYIRMPLLGSDDHVKFLMTGIKMDEDFNNYDSTQAVMNHPKMTKEELEQSFWLAWEQFYTIGHMVTSLKRLPLKNYWSVILNYLWYYWSSVCEKSHPMLCGIKRIRTFKDRRPSGRPISLPKHIVNEIWRHLRYIGYLFKTFYIFQDVYFQTKWLPKLADKVSGFDLNVRVKKIIDEVKRHETAWLLRVKKAGWFSKTFGFNAHRSWLNDFWRRYGQQKWKLLFKFWWHISMLPHALTEIIYAIRFGSSLVRIITQI